MSSVLPFTLTCPRCGHIFLSTAAVCTSCHICKKTIRIRSLNSNGYIGQSLVIWAQNNPEIIQEIINIGLESRWVHRDDVIAKFYERHNIPLVTTRTGKAVKGEGLGAYKNRVTYAPSTRPDLFELYRTAKNGQMDSLWINKAWGGA